MAFQPTQIVLTAAFLLLRGRQATAGKLAPPPFPSNFPNLHRKTADSPDARLVRALLSSPEPRDIVSPQEPQRTACSVVSSPTCSVSKVVVTEQPGSMFLCKQARNPILLLTWRCCSDIFPSLYTPLPRTQFIDICLTLFNLSVRVS